MFGWIAFRPLSKSKNVDQTSFSKPQQKQKWLRWGWYSKRANVWPNCYQTTFKELSRLLSISRNIGFTPWFSCQGSRVKIPQELSPTMLPPADILNFVVLSFGFISSIVLSKLLLKFYSTILFADRNIFTHLNRAAILAIQVMVQSRVSVVGLYRAGYFLIYHSSDSDWADTPNPPGASLRCYSYSDNFQNFGDACGQTFLMIRDYVI